MSTRQAARRPKESTEGGSVVRGHRILVVEDDLFFQEYVSDLLTREGAEVIRAPDGESALSQVAASRPSIILIDLEIPKIHGFELLRILRSRPDTSSIPLIMMSGKVDREVFDRHAQGRVRADGYLIKPFSPPELLSALRLALHPGERAVPRKAPPATQAAAGATTASSPSPSPRGDPGKPPTILVVDDSDHIRSMVGDFLREAGAEVLEAADGKAGLARAIQVKPDGVLLDVQMPHLNGFVVCELLKKDPATRSIPIIIMSAVADEETFRKHSRLKNRADAYLLKPFKKGDLLALLSRLTGHRAFASPRPPDKSDFVLPPSPESSDSPPFSAGAAAGASREGELSELVGRLTAERDRIQEEARRQAFADEERKQELAEKLSLALKRLEDLDSGAGKEQEQSRRLAESLAAAEAAGLQAEEEKKGLEARLKKQEGEIASARGNAAELEKVRKLAARETGLRRDLEIQVKTLSAERDAALDDQSRVKAVSGKTAGKAQEMEKKLATVQQELAAARKMAAGETAARMEAESKLVSIIQERDMAGKEAADLRGKLAGEGSLGDRLAAAENERREAVAELQKLRDERARAEKDQREKEASSAIRSASGEKARAQLEKEQASLKEELAVAVKRAAESDALALRLREREEMVRDMEKRLADEAARIKGLREDLARALEEGERIRSEHSRGEKDREGARARLDREKADADREIAALRDRAAALDKEKAEALARSSALSEELAAIRRDVERAKAGLGETEKKALEREGDLRREQAGRKKAEEEAAAGRKAAEAAALQHAALERAVAAEKETAAAGRKESAILQQKLTAEEKKALDLADSLAAEERKGRELHLEAEKGKAARTHLENSLAENRKKLEETAHARDGLEKALADTRQKLEESVKARELQDKATAGLRKTMEEGERARAALEKSLSEEKARHLAAVEQGKRLQAEGESLRRALAATGEKGGKLEAVLRDLEGKGKALAADLEKEKQFRSAAESALLESRKEGERLEGEREKREGALKAETARVAKDKAETARRLEEAQGEGRKLAEKIKAAEAATAGAREKEREAADDLARIRGVLDAALHQARGLLGAPAGSKEGLEALVRSLAATLEKEFPKGKGAFAARVGGVSRAVLAVALVAGLFAGAAGGYLVLPGLLGGRAADVSDPASGEPAAPSAAGSPIDDSPALIEYAKSWSRLTQETAQADLGIQATLHSAAEAELALDLIARKDGWSAAKLRDAVSEARQVLGGDVLVATVLVKAGTHAAPSEGELLKRLMVKDPWGKMIPAVDLGKARGLGKSLVAAARAPNPDYRDATGVTVAFPRRGLRLEAKTLQLVLAPTGDQPGRMVTWDLSGWGG